MRVILHLVELNNFKTYKGKVIIGPLKPFMSVIGPNGTGKSNLLDAILFAFGAKLTELRVKKPGELIHGAPIKKPVAKNAYVAVVFKHEDGTLSNFRRVASRSTEEYFFNGAGVSKSQYLDELKDLGINIKANNFFVYQGRVEEIAVMNAKERTALFEEISGSNEYKKQYEQLKSQMNQLGSETQSNFAKQRTFRNEYKDAQIMSKEAKNFEQLQQELVDKKTLLRLFKLFHIEENYKIHQEKKSEKQDQVQSEESAKKECQRKLKEARISHSKAEKALNKMENEVQVKEKEFKKQLPKILKDKEKLSHIRRKISTAKLSLQQAQEAHEKHEDTLKILERELSNVEEQQQRYETQVAEMSMSQGRGIELEESQAAEYNELKRQAVILSAPIQQKLESLTREFRAGQDRIDNKKRKYTELEIKIKQKQHEKEEAIKRSDKISIRILSNEEELKALNERAVSTSDISTLKGQMDKMQDELNKVISELRDAQSDRNEHGDLNRKHNVTKTLIDLFPGVYGRLISLCEPIHAKYKIALTKVMGKWVDAIVVDKERTARLCIQYLKDHMMQPEVFMPLDYLEVKPIRDNYREIRGAHLVYDVVRYNPPEIKRAVMFATKSVLVCETADDAVQVAYETFPRRQLDVVSLDGIYFQKSGLISGGSHDHLAQKARQWDEKFLNQLEERKENLTQSLKSIAKQIRLTSESNVSLEIKGYNTRITLMKIDLQKMKSNIATMDTELQELQIKLKNLESEIEDDQNEVQFQDAEVKKLDRLLRSKEDEVFGQFCEEIGVANIRTYEEGGLRSQKERVVARMEFEEQKTRILNEIEYQKTVDSEAKIKRWSDEVESRLKEEGEVQKTIEEHNTVIAADQQELEQYKEQVASKKIEVASLLQGKHELEKETKSKSEAAHIAQQELLSVESEIERLINTRRLLLIDCKAEGIVIPLLQGDLESLAAGRPDSASESSSADSDTIIIAFDNLPDNLKIIDEDKVKENEEKLTNAVLNLSKRLRLMKVPNLRAEEAVDETGRKLRETAVECKETRERAKEITGNFERIKRSRHDKYMDVFDFVSEKIDSIYKEITQSNSAMALISAENPEEPYLNGVHYNCIVPGKACKPMEILSGGEKTIASLALLLALHQYGASPCLILDEVDAALDNINIGKVVHYLRNVKGDFQTIAVSLRPEYFGGTDALIGVTRGLQDGELPKSEVYMFDLEEYPMDEE